MGNTDFSGCDLNIFEPPVPRRALGKVRPIRKPLRLPRPPGRGARKLGQRAAAHAEGELPLGQEAPCKGDDRRRVAHQEDARMLPRELALDLGKEGREEAVGALVDLLHVLALARGVPDGGPGGIDFGEVFLEGGGGSGARVEPCPRGDGGVPFCDPWGV
jgi:hypothetical protein